MHYLLASPRSDASAPETAATGGSTITYSPLTADVFGLAEVDVQNRCAATTSGAVLTAVALALVAAGAAAADQVVDELTGFTSPSGNIGCLIEPSYVRCDIRERDWSPPPRLAECEFDYGQGIALTGGKRATFVCAGDTALGGGDPLAYGASISAGTVTCTSTPSAMTCTDTPSGHGFTMSRQSYAIS